MARPVKQRRICAMPCVASFGPEGQCRGEPLEMTLDEYEAIRLIDALGMSQEAAAAQMNVARTTVQAIYDAARGKLAAALVEGRRLVIRGGCYELCPQAAECCGKDCRRRCGKSPCGQERPCGGCKNNY